MFVHDLPANPIVRAAPVGLALQRLGFDIEVIGLLKEGAALYPPYATSFPYKTSASTDDLPRLASGDICYAFKPLFTTFWPALVASGFGRRKPLLLDVEDDDCHVCGRSHSYRLARFGRRCVRSFSRSLKATAAHELRICCDATTVSSTVLQRFYGGEKLLHGPDEVLFDPNRSDLDRTEARRFFGLPDGATCVLFAGMPKPHKGLSEIVEAVSRTEAHLVLAGDSTVAEFGLARAQLHDRCSLVGMVSNQEMPRLLTAVDIVPVPQHDVAYARAQLPAKLIEAMAMGKSVIASDVGDLPELIGVNTNEPRGWLVPPNDASALATTFREIMLSKGEANARGSAARIYFQKNASVESNANLLRSIFESHRRLRRYL